MKDELALLQKLKAGENNAYQEVLRLYGSMLLGYAKRMVGSKDNAEEVVQEAIVSIFASIDRFEGQCSIRSWLFRIVHHKAVDYLRKNSRFVKLTPRDDETMEEMFDHKGFWSNPPNVWKHDLEERLNAKQMLELVQTKMDSLPHNYKEIILLREVYKLDTEEVCNTLNITPVHARVMLHRARQALYRAVDDHLQQTGQGAATS